jgi:hypothetical protein
MRRLRIVIKDKAQGCWNFGGDPNPRVPALPDNVRILVAAPELLKPYVGVLHPYADTANCYFSFLPTLYDLVFQECVMV